MNSKRGFVAVMLIIYIAGIALFASGCSRQSENTGNMAENVKAIKLVYTSMGVEAEFPGKLKPEQEITISAKTSGYVEAVNYDIAMKVKQGDILVNMDKRDAEAQYGLAKASLDNANANLVRTSDSSLQQQVNQAEAAVEQAQLQYDDAKSSYDRVKQLYDAGAMSKQDMDNAESKYKNSQIQLQTSKDNLDLLKGSGGTQLVNVAKAQVEQAEASVRSTALMLDYTKITAPISGTVSAKYVDAGEFVTAGTPLMTIIVDDSSMLVETGVPEEVVKCIAVGQQANVRFDSGDAAVATAKVESISPNIDPKTQNYLVKLRLDGAGQGITPGMIASVSFRLKWVDKAIAVPNEALIIDGSSAYVMSVKDSTARRLPVKTGITNESLTEIVDGLKAGDVVITEGQNLVNDGDKVIITK